MKKIIIFSITILLMTIIYVSFSKTKVLGNTYDISNEREFRAAWVSYYTGDVNFKSVNDYKSQIDHILDTLEYYNMNAIIFHIRANHDAWYNSKINKINSQLNNVDFEEFDPLEYVIDESHKRGIEFHAWMNPYRIGSIYTSVESVNSAFSEFPLNPASKAENVLIGSTLQILNPGESEVRDFIVDSCLEVCENYDVDAIHFDDYFYANGIDDSITFQKYKHSGQNISDFRREQVTRFIMDLKQELDLFNKENNRFVQLGISPTGVYKNANSQTEANTPVSEYKFNPNGNLIYPIGATIGCQMHFESYLYCDTLHWVNNELINYILPQTYWSTSHSRAPFEKLINWWNQAVKYKDVNLYSGMGLYMWTSENAQAINQLQVVSSLDFVLGTSIYSFKQLSSAYLKSDMNAYEQMNLVKQHAWNNKTILPEIAGFDSEEIGYVSNLIIEENFLSWDSLKNAKFYVIYRSKGAITYRNDEIVAIVGSKNEIVSWTDKEKGNFIYDVVPMSYTNTLGKKTNKVFEGFESTIDYKVTTDQQGLNVLEGDKSYNALLSNSNVYLKLLNDNTNDFNYVSGNNNIATINSGIIELKNVGTTRIKAIHKTDISKKVEFELNVCNLTDLEKIFEVEFYYPDGTLIKTENVKYGHSITDIENVTLSGNEKYEFTFIGWNKNVFNITKDIKVTAVFDASIRKYTVTFKNDDGSIIEEILVPYGTYPTMPSDPKKEPTKTEYFTFDHWDYNEEVITSDIEIKAVFVSNSRLYSIRVHNPFVDGVPLYGYFSDEEIKSISYKEIDGYEFQGWFLDENYQTEIKFPMFLTDNIDVYAKFARIISVTIVDEYGYKIDKYYDLEGNKVNYSYGIPKEGYTFKGFTIDPSNNNLIEELPNEDCTLYLVYEQNIQKKNCKLFQCSIMLICSIPFIIICFKKKKF